MLKVLFTSRKNSPDVSASIIAGTAITVRCAVMCGVMHVRRRKQQLAGLEGKKTAK
jgi:hypothetical protein